MAYRLLHLTDLHFTQSSHWLASPSELNSPLRSDEAKDIARKHFEDLRRALSAHQETQPPFDAIVLGGDFTHRHHRHGFAIAEAFIQLLVNEGEEQGALTKRGRILAVPGNHDVNLGKTYHVFTGQQQAEAKKTPTAVLSIPQSEREREYRDFLAGAEGHLAPANEHLSSVLRITKPLRISEDEEKRGLVLVGLNSCRIERHSAQGWGYVGLDQVDAVLQALLKEPPLEGDALVAIAHHNPLPLWDLDLPVLASDVGDRKISFLTDASSVLEALTSCGFSLLLHGHSHRPKLASLEGYDFRPKAIRKKLVISGQGSFCATPAGWDMHNLAVIQIEPRDVFVFGISAPETTATVDRRWDSPPAGDNQPTSEVWNWKARRVREALDHLSDRSKVAAVQWEIMESWAPLYVRESQGRDAQEWLNALKQLAGDVSNAAGRPIETEVVQKVIDNMLGSEKQAGGFNSKDMSTLYLPQYILLRLESNGLES
ncbi:MAG TPA: metallophosphoesterase [Bryobacteraceae bacterium]|nr:metallophosphoesterase [Bryobacteraceae bacterium]